MAWKRWQDWINLLLGLWLIVAPYVIAFPGAASAGASATFWVGIGVALIAVWALAMPGLQAAEWCQILLAAGYFFAPWVFGFAGTPAWNAWIVSLLVICLAAAALPVTRAATEGTTATGRSGRR